MWGSFDFRSVYHLGAVVAVSHDAMVSVGQSVDFLLLIPMDCFHLLGELFSGFITAVATVLGDVFLPSFYFSTSMATHTR